MKARVVWYREERSMPAGGRRQVRVAWIVADDPDSMPGAPRHLAYLGGDPTISAQLREEFSHLYPEIEVDWDALTQAAQAVQTEVAKLSLDELGFKVRAILGEHGILLDELDFRLGKGWRRPLRQIELFSRDPGVVGRFERTSGSMFAYLSEKHPESAYALLKVRALISGGEDELAKMEAAEPDFGPGTRFSQFRGYCRKVLATETEPPQT